MVHSDTHHDCDCDESFSPYFAPVDDILSDPLSSVLPSPRFYVPPSSPEGIRCMPLPGVRCPTCAKKGQEVWVIPGRACGFCGTECV